MAFKYNPIEQTLDLVSEPLSPEVATWQKYTVTYSQLSAAATTNNITLTTLAAKTSVEGVVIKHSTRFSGGAISAYTVSIGPAGDLAGLASAFDVYQAVGNSVYQSTVILAVPSFSGTTAIKIAATSTGANLNAATGGSVDVWLKTSVLE